MPKSWIFNVANYVFNAFRENIILTEISEFTVSMIAILKWHKVNATYSKTCLKRPLKEDKKGFQDR